MFQEFLSKLHDWMMFFSAWSKTAMSIEYRLPTGITVLVIVIKFLVNRAVCALDFKKAGIELPCEIITLSLGFIIIRVESTMEQLYRMVVLVILLAVTASVVNYLQREEVISKIGFFTTHFWWCIICYVLAIFSFYYSMNVVIG